MDPFEYVLAIAEERNITKAASRMFITQPALTLRINRLENDLGIKIFDRSKSPIEITKEGELYITEMKKIKAHEEKLRNALYEMTHQANQHLTIGIGLNRGRFWLPRLLPHLQHLDPSLTFQVYEASDGTIEQLIKEGTVDVGIMGSAVLSQELCSIPLGKEQVFLAVPPKHSALNRLDTSDNGPEKPCIISPEQLNGQSFIFGTQPYGLTRFCNLIFSLYHITPGNVLNVGNSETAYLLSGRGIGITATFKDYHYLPLPFASMERPILCTIENHILERNTVLACKLARMDDKLVQLVANEIQKLFY